MKASLIVLSVLVLGLAGCANNQVIVDTKGVDMSRYQQDRRECEGYVEQVSSGGTIAKSAGLGAVIGAVVGGAAGAIFGDSTAAARGAAVGGVTGGAQGSVSGIAKGENSKEQVLRNCLSGRGYRVLN
ncbi:hypothetical protein DFR24_0715 [Panacagrimonas perspica]|uniref:Glycine zipper family protein n=1 Tax=Panacagrimonas perspica TaxID=381431 RepID=A0A4R7PBH4_9GAMM|nr:glycine zipper family protein [Panacagrimonas perspica]TDU31347.1 hypothetical protein DFR24_0715 [Panacagrimonas perspica]THD00765.1 glycine zipper family protein [Panacagrimonas perspica]